MTREQAGTGGVGAGSGLGVEAVPPRESEFTIRLTELLRAKLTREYPQAPMRRDAHPKHHACVRAELEVAAGLPADLAHGLFARPGRYPVFVRFSNQSGTPQADRLGDIRGVALKVLGVPGRKLLTGDDTPTHDFVLITGDRFVTHDVQEFHDLIQATLAARWRLWLFLLCHPRAAWILWRSLRPCGDVLAATYTSPTPYRLGDGAAVRYRLRPRLARAHAGPDRGDADYLRRRLVDDLAAAPAAFDFMVQLQTDPRRMPIEDPGVRWPETLSPYQSVATLHVPRQDAAAPDLAELAEHLSFNPWRCLEAHRPLGGINRARKSIYAALAQHRRRFNSTEWSEDDVARRFAAAGA